MSAAGLSVSRRREYRIEALDGSTWDAYADLIEANNGIFGGCWCMGFHPADDPEDAQFESKRERKRQRVLTGRAHAALVFDGDRCLGWCQFGRPDELPRIKSRKEYERDAGPPPDWRISCFFVGKGLRRQGVAAAALAGAVQLIAEQGGGVVEGYPESADAVPAGFLYNGALSTYDALGFQRQRMIGKHRWVVTLDVPAASPNQ
jgi:GNAT superfamily N-acetyltransferase